MPAAGDRPSRCRPAFWVALSFAAGIAISSECGAGIPAHYLCIAATTAFVAAVGGIVSRLDTGRRVWSLIFLLLPASLGAARYQLVTAMYPPGHIANLSTLFGQEGIVRGIVDGEPEHVDDKQRFVLELQSFEAESGEYATSGTLLVTTRGMSLHADHADEVALRGKLRRPQPARNPGAFDYRRFLELRGIHGLLSLRRERQIISVTPSEGHWLYERVVVRTREAVRGAIDANLSGEPAGLLRGILLGEKHGIGDRVRDNFRKTGLAHALVISGLHVGLVALFFYTGFRLCRLSDATASTATVVVLGVYACVTALQAPVVRASIMAAVVLVGRAIGRDGEIYNSLGLAALIILAIWPTSLLTLSFQLSFAATISIVALHDPLRSLFPRRWRQDESTPFAKWIVSPLCVSMAAQLGTGPLIAEHFQQFAPLSLAANLIVVPLLGLVVSLGLLAVLAGPWLPLAGTLFNGANYLVMETLTAAVNLFASIPYASIVVPRPGLLPLIGAAAATILLAQAWNHMIARKALAYLSLVGLNAIAWGHRLEGSRDLEVVFLDVGQGDSAFLQFPNGATMLIDGGNRSRYFDNGSRVVVPFLKAHNTRGVDVVVSSHPHSDHIGGLVAVLEQMPVRHFVDSGQECDTWTARRLRQLIREKGIQYHRVAAGDSLAGLGGVEALVLHPTEEFVDAEGASPHGLNNGSVVMQFRYGNTSLMFTGDAEVETDEPILRWGGRLDIDILKVAHHGSPTSSRPRFIEALSPTTSVVSVGEVNSFGHPSAGVLDRLQARGSTVYRTDLCGAAIARIRGDRTEWRTMIGDCARL